MLEYVPAMLTAFLARHTNIDVDLEEAKGPDIMRTVAAGRADIGIVAGAIHPDGRAIAGTITDLFALFMPFSADNPSRQGRHRKWRGRFGSSQSC